MEANANINSIKERRSKGGALCASPNSMVSSRFLIVSAFVIASVFVWMYMHKTFLITNSRSDRALPNGVAPTTENLMRLQRILDESKALLKEIKSANITVSAHSSHEIVAMEAGRSVLAEELDALKRQFSVVQSDLLQCKNSQEHVKSSVHLINTQNEAEELRKHLHECQEQLISAHDASKNKISDREPVPEDTWLFIGIPTVARAENQDYLLQTLASIRHQLPTDANDLLFRRVKVLVLNVEGPSHKRFYEAQTMFAAGHATPDSADVNGTGANSVVIDHRPDVHEPHKGRNHAHSYFEFVTISEEYKTSASDFKDTKRGATPENDEGNANVPGYRVRKQTRSIAEVLKRARGRAKYYMFLEDDMLLCPHGFHSIHYLLSKASKFAPDWLAIRASYGMNGIFIHDKDIEHFYRYLLDNQIRRPPDHLAVEWFAGESKVSGAYKNGRAHVAYRFNLFDHIGISSTLRRAKQTSFPRCYDTLGVPTLFEVEAFNPRECPKDDIWPCKIGGNRRDLDADRAIVRWNVH